MPLDRSEPGIISLQLNIDITISCLFNTKAIAGQQAAPEPCNCEPQEATTAQAQFQLPSPSYNLRPLRPCAPMPQSIFVAVFLLPLLMRHAWPGCWIMWGLLQALQRFLKSTIALRPIYCFRVLYTTALFKPGVLNPWATAHYWPWPICNRATQVADLHTQACATQCA